MACAKERALQCDWRTPEMRPALHGDAVHVWRIALAQPAARVRELASVLSHEEREQAERFHFEHLRQRFVVSHAALRLLLAQYAGVAAAQVQFTFGTQGKPALAYPSALKFNLSHSEDFALVALARECEVGVDIERVRPVLELEQIARSNFAPREVATLLALPPAEQHAAFFNGWTRKEAFIKAVGNGLSFPLEQFEVSLAPHAVARLLSIRGSATAAAHWSLFALHPADGYAAALALPRAEAELCCWNWMQN